MHVADFDYHLPAEQIAQQAATPRHAARMLVLDRCDGAGPRHRQVFDLPQELDPGDLLVVNNTRVLPARLLARKPTGGRVEVFLLEALDQTRRCWRALLGASRLPAEGSRVQVAEGFEVEILARREGVAEVRLLGDAEPDLLIERHGLPPLPPYIRRDEDDPRLDDDRRRYQTLFARHAGAVAAPTAGLHFSEDLLAALERRGSRVVAVGTTAVRALESREPGEEGVPGAGGEQTRLFISPGFAFRYVDALLTNFHLPRSSLLMLVAAFAGRERVLAAYRLAVAEGYRFYSYGDAMLVL